MDFKFAVCILPPVLIPLNIILDPDDVQVISVFVISNNDSSPNNSILLTNSGIIEICAEVIVYLVNKITHLALQYNIFWQVHISRIFYNQQRMNLKYHQF